MNLHYFILFCMAFLCQASHIFAKCEVEWKGLANTYDYSARRTGKLSFNDCCLNTRSQASQDAQNAWNIQKASFASAVQKNTKISGSGSPKCITGCSGSLESSSGSSSAAEIEYGDTRWTVTANCDCLEDGFISEEGGCQPITGTDLLPFLGRKLRQNCPGSGREKDKCSIKIACTFRAVTPTDCDNIGVDKSENTGTGTGTNTNTNTNTGTGTNTNVGVGSNPYFVDGSSECSCIEQCQTFPRIPGYSPGTPPECQTYYGRKSCVVPNSCYRGRYVNGRKYLCCY